MNWLDWVIVAIVMLAIIVVIRFIQKITTLIVTLLITLVIIGLVIYFLSQWSLTPQLIIEVIHTSSMAAFFANLGNWIFHTLLGWGKEYVS